MLLLDEVVAWDATRVECRVVLRDDSPFVDAGRVASTLAIEYMAQCIAVFVGLYEEVLFNVAGPQDVFHCWTL